MNQNKTYMFLIALLVLSLLNGYSGITGLGYNQLYPNSFPPNCPANQYMYGVTSSSDVCSQVGYNQLNSFPSNCPQGQYVYGLTSNNLLCNPSITQTTIKGTTAGTATCEEPFQESTYKVVMCYLNGYENKQSTAQTYTYPAPFTYAPLVSGVSGASSTTTALSLPKSMTSAVTGWVEANGW
jgi:hypothetical protein